MFDSTALALTGLAGVVIGGALGAAWGRARTRRIGAERDRVAAALEERDRTAAASEAVREVIDAAMEEGVLLFDDSDRLVYANEASERHLGRRSASIAQLFPAAAAEAAAAAAASRDPHVAEMETGSLPRWLRVAATPAGGGGTLVVVSDVTESRRVEAVRRDFVVNASHELKTPAASIQAAAETLRVALRDDPEAVHRFAATLDQEAARLSRIVADLLDLSRLEAGGSLGDSVRLDALVADEARRYVDRARDAQLTLDLRIEPVPPVPGSERDLALLVDNLIDNAIRYTPAGGNVDVSVRASDDGIQLRVADTGIGIHQRDLSRVMERFYRVDQGRSRRSGGTGLGLSIVRHVAENHGGSVALSSELGRGTTVDVTLPVNGKA